jgi:hypothetical protein
MWSSYGLQNMNLANYILTMSTSTSDVTLQPPPATGNGIAPEQNLVFQNGLLWNPGPNVYQTFCLHHYHCPIKSVGIWQVIQASSRFVGKAGACSSVKVNTDLARKHQRQTYKTFAAVIY